ncbi:MAG: bifunctional phosphoribosylaminoimidazolecarboxamide formyltransferase/IMP cyclohydrolase [Christensenellaceae bacterium]|jgi:phosphoribosylaminoimidazolecarboxamide formyltransferase/IMP cyclohydrolase|nr:bifunctional phosphoribosylaminoimidazolecarboxamide formyltransferase/IMP cyclohydrolase [Christensenellaceae bacterium]
MKKRALLSVSDKTGIIDFARELEKLDYEICSTGGTLKALQDAKINAINVSDITGFLECLDGRVKTLHPVVHAGILAMRDNESHVEQLKSLDITPIDIVAVNLYPFKQTITKANVTLEDAIENIDIGGPTMIRSAAKNYKDVFVVCDPNDYDLVISEIKSKSSDTLKLKFKLMTKAFRHTAAYDSIISNYLTDIESNDFPENLTLTYQLKQPMRYGENPSQRAAFYADGISQKCSLANAIQLQGKELSFNNINDADGALDTLREFNSPACVAVKHANPCGVGEASNIFDAYMSAYESDKISIFGGIVALNRAVDKKLAEELSKTFLEIVIAPDFTDDALNIYALKKNVRLLKLPDLSIPVLKTTRDIKKVLGGLLVQDYDFTLFDEKDLKVVTKLKPTEEQLDALRFAFKVVKHVKSNAIVVATNGKTLGIGMGQPNRIWAAERALTHAGEKARGAVLASDAFFPFPDCVEIAEKFGISCIIQPGGSIKDKESIIACDKLGIAMVLCGSRHFKH